jgi:small multidrug resistance family-3 protein
MRTAADHDAAAVPHFVASYDVLHPTNGGHTELGGCYLVFLWTRGGRSLALLGAAAVALGVFAWLLSFHPTAGRAYAAYGGVYVAVAVAWGWLVERIHPDRWTSIGAAVALLGMGSIAFGPGR